MKLLSLLAAMCMLVCAPAIAFAKSPATTKSISKEALILKEVDTLVSLMTDGPADQDGEPEIVYAPSGPSPDDAIVLITIGSWHGGNGSRQFLAAFSKTDSEDWSPNWPVHPYALSALIQIGHDEGEWDFEADKISIDSDNIITVSGHSWGPNDAHCCPSVSKTLKVKYSDFSLTLLSH